MSTVAKKVIMGSGAVAEAYEIEQSIIYNSGAAPQMYFDPSSNFTSETVFTFSTWVKRASTGASQRLLTAGYYAAAINQSGVTIQFHSSDVLRVNFRREGSVTYNNQSIDSTALFRDPAAWYHILVTRNGTAIRGYVNGVEVLSGTMTANSVVGIQNTYPVMVGVSSKPTSSAIGAYESFNGNLAETHFIDGTAKATSDFGETNSDTGQWIPKEYSGSYGTNGFYLKFASGGIGADSSGNSNTMTVANLTLYEVVSDSPTNNFATWNPLIKGTNTYSQGNLRGTNSTSAGAFMASTIGVSSGKYYCEIIIPSLVNWNVGIANSSAERSFIGVDAGSGGWLLYASSTTQYVASSYSSISQGWEVGNYVGLGIDADNKVFYLYKNGTQVISYDYSGFAGDEAFFGAGNYSAVANTIVNFGQNPTHCGTVSAGTATDGNGIGLFQYAPPSGFLALCTANLPDPAIPLPEEHFNTVLWAGDGQTNRAITGVGHASDFVWVKSRTDTEWHNLYDKIRGVGKQVWSNSTSAETTYDSGEGLKAFDADGFTVGNSEIINRASQNFVGWSWKANGSGSTDTSGDIDAVVSANQAAGFSIVTWTSNGSNAGTIPHGLGVTPELIFYKTRGQAARWHVFIIGLIDGSIDYMHLDDTIVKQNSLSQWGAPTSSMISNIGFGNTQPIVAYNFVSKPSFSKMGVYTGNGNASGPFINTGFKPAWLMIKNTSNAQDWILFDNKRDPFNVTQTFLYPNLASADALGGAGVIDLLSNGFKLRNAGTRNRNYNGDVYLFMAFADSPFKSATAH